MSKISVETTGDFMLLDIFGGQEIAENGATPVNKTPFVANALKNDQLRLAGDVVKAEDEPVVEPDVPETLVQVEPVEPVVEPVVKPATKPTSGKAAKKA